MASQRRSTLRDQPTQRSLAQSTGALVSAFEGTEVATLLGTRRRKVKVRPMLKAVRSGTVTMKDGTRHEVTAERTLWHGSLLSRMEPRFAAYFVAIDAAEEMRNARRSRRSRRSTRRPRERWRLP
jgi:hypothetical protein